MEYRFYKQAPEKDGCNCWVVMTSAEVKGKGICETIQFGNNTAADIPEYEEKQPEQLHLRLINPV